MVPIRPAKAHAELKWRTVLRRKPERNLLANLRVAGMLYARSGDAHEHQNSSRYEKRCAFPVSQQQRPLDAK